MDKPKDIWFSSVDRRLTALTQAIQGLIRAVTDDGLVVEVSGNRHILRKVLLRTKDVAKLTGFSRTYITKAVTLGHLKSCANSGGSGGRRFLMRDVLDWIQRGAPSGAKVKRDHLWTAAVVQPVSCETSARDHLRPDRIR